MKKILCLTVGAFGLALAAGCITVSLVHVGDNQTIGEGDAQMESNADIADSFTDLLKSSTRVIPGGGDEIVEDVIEEIDDENAEEPNGGGGNGDEHDEGYAYRPADGFVFKQKSESDNKTVIIDPSSTQQTMSALGASGTSYPLRFSGVHNGNRAHFRSSEVIDDFPLMVSGSKSWTVPGP